MTHEDAQVPRTPKPVPDTPDNVLDQLCMKGKATAITGAADGIGLAVAEGIAEAGGDVALLYNSNDSAIAKAAELSDRYEVVAKAYKMQLSDPHQVEITIQSIVKDFGKLSVFIANAGMTIPKSLLETSLEEYRTQVSVNRESETRNNHLHIPY